MWNGSFFLPITWIVSDLCRLHCVNEYRACLQVLLTPDLSWEKQASEQRKRIGTDRKTINAISTGKHRRDSESMCGLFSFAYHRRHAVLYLPIPHRRRHVHNTSSAWRLHVALTLAPSPSPRPPMHPLMPLIAHFILRSLLVCYCMLPFFPLHS